MKRGVRWLFLGVVVLGIAAGLTIGGRPAAPVNLLITEPPRTTSTSQAVDVPTSDVPTTDTPVPDASAASDETLREVTSVVVANAAGERGLASRVASRLVERGWLAAVPADALVTDSITRVYFADRFEDAARLVVADLGLTDIEVAPVPGGRLTVDGESGDVVVLLGADPEA